MNPLHRPPTANNALEMSADQVPPALHNKLTLFLSAGTPSTLPLACSLRSHGSHLILGITTPPNLNTAVQTVFAAPSLNNAHLTARAVSPTIEELALLAGDAGQVDVIVLDEELVGVVEGPMKRCVGARTVVVVMTEGCREARVVWGREVGGVDVTREHSVREMEKVIGVVKG